MSPDFLRHPEEFDFGHEHCSCQPNPYNPGGVFQPSTRVALIRNRSSSTVGYELWIGYSLSLDHGSVIAVATWKDWRGVRAVSAEQIREIEYRVLDQEYKRYSLMRLPEELAITRLLKAQMHAFAEHVAPGAVCGARLSRSVRVGGGDAELRLARRQLAGEWLDARLGLQACRDDENSPVSTCPRWPALRRRTRLAKRIGGTTSRAACFLTAIVTAALPDFFKAVQA
jgi:hypothetical protein